MKIKKTYVDYMKDFYIGQRAYFIELDTHGYEEKIEEIVKLSSNHNIIVITGDEELNEQQEIINYTKELKKINPQIKILLHINGNKKPKNTPIQIEYIVRPTKDIDEKTIQWLIKADAKFIFTIRDEDDLEHVNTLAAALLIKKTQIFLEIKNEYEKHKEKAKLYGYNIYVKLEGEW